jgi:hypothetical protein
MIIGYEFARKLTESGALKICGLCSRSAAAPAA